MIENFPSGVALIPEYFGISEKDMIHLVVKWDVEDVTLGWNLEWQAEIFVLMVKIGAGVGGSR